jgi:hypothetical protein
MQIFIANLITVSSRIEYFCVNNYYDLNIDIRFDLYEGSTEVQRSQRNSYERF